MQANNSSRFFKNFMIGLVASSAGAFIALPGAAMPEPGAELEAAEEVVEPTAVEALPTPGAEALETIPAAGVDAVEEEIIVDEVEATEEPIADETEVMEEPVAEDEVEATEEPIADETEVMEEPVAEDEVTDEEPVAAEEMDTAAFTIAELTDNSESFEILAAALAAADLTEILGSEGPFTVFAPTDDAFAALPEGSVDQLLMPENKDVLVQVLTYHVVPGAILSTDLEDGGVATVEGSEVEIAIADTVTVNNANVVAADIEASNGVIHVIDRVIIPPSPEAGADADAEVDETASSVAE
ncbi:MAG: fasciclin domain-containing protein [Cyanobacteria bacterium P01_C01_bin.121]